VTGKAVAGERDFFKDDAASVMPRPAPHILPDQRREIALAVSASTKLADMRRPCRHRANRRRGKRRRFCGSLPGLPDGLSSLACTIYPLAAPALDSLKVLFEPFEDRFHRFIRPFPIHIEVEPLSA